VLQLVQSSYSRYKPACRQAGLATPVAEQARYGAGKGKQLGNQGLQVLVLGQQSFHLIQNHGRIFILLRPVKSSKIVEQGEPKRKYPLVVFFFLFCKRIEPKALVLFKSEAIDYKT